MQRKITPRGLLCAALGLALWLGAGREAHASEEDSTYTVNVTTPGTFAVTALSQVNNWSDIKHLTVTGELNNSDVTYFKSMGNLVTIDLSGADLDTIGSFTKLENLTTVTLPNSVRVVDSKAFYGCSSLTTINLDSATYIGTYAFNRCKKLATVSLPSATYIGDYAFYFCYALTTVSIPSATRIAQFAFGGCYSLTTVSLPSATYIGEYAFTACTALEDVWCYALVPPTCTSTSWPGSSDLVDCTLHVPTFCRAMYQLDKYWFLFGNVEEITDELTDVEIETDYTVVTPDGMSRDGHLGLVSNGSEAGHLLLSTSGDTLRVGRFSQAVGMDTWSKSTSSGYTTYTYPCISTLLANSPLRADTTEVRMTLPTGQWSFISFPYNVDVADIEVPEDAQWVVRSYDGASRAENGTGSNWQDVGSDGTLEAGKGYIFHCASTDDAIEVVFPAKNDSARYGLYAIDDVTLTLETYEATSSNDQSWNLVGNPYPAYFDIQYMDFDAPVQTWTGSAYMAYTSTDDDYTLRPNEAFFVQAPTEDTSMTFETGGRSHDGTSSYASAPRRRAAQAEERQVLNFFLSDGETSDRARLALNDAASADYEISRDAAKMLSSGVPQLWVLDGGLQYAIDERPATGGEYVLGARFATGGEHTLTLRTKGCDTDVWLTDTQTGERTLLSEEPYTFDAEAGTCEARFVVTLGTITTGIDTLADGDATTTGTFTSIHTLDGRTLNAQSLKELPGGVYVVKEANGQARKVMVK